MIHNLDILDIVKVKYVLSDFKISTVLRSLALNITKRSNCVIYSSRYLSVLKASLWILQLEGKFAKLWLRMIARCSLQSISTDL